MTYTTGHLEFTISAHRDLQVVVVPPIAVAVREIISVMVMLMCVGIVVVEYDRRRLGLPSAPPIMKYDNKRDHRNIATAIAIALNLPLPIPLPLP